MWRKYRRAHQKIKSTSALSRCPVDLLCRHQRLGTRLANHTEVKAICRSALNSNSSVSGPGFVRTSTTDTPCRRSPLLGRQCLKMACSGHRTANGASRNHERTAELSRPVPWPRCITLEREYLIVPQHRWIDPAQAAFNFLHGPLAFTGLQMGDEQFVAALEMAQFLGE